LSGASLTQTCFAMNSERILIIGSMLTAPGDPGAFVISEVILLMT